MATGRFAAGDGPPALLGWAPGPDATFVLPAAAGPANAGTLWWNTAHPTWVAARKVFPADPATAALACAVAVLAERPPPAGDGEPPWPARLAAQADLEREVGSP